MNDSRATKPAEVSRTKKPKRGFRIPRRYRKRSIALFVVLAHIAGAFTSVEAIMRTRTPQGSIAWAISLNLFPYGAVPAYWMFGHTDLGGYVVARRSEAEKFKPVADRLRSSLTENDLRVEMESSMARTLEALAHLSFTRRNSTELLIDGKAAFDSMFEAIDQAESYILIQFYIFRADGLGNELKERLIARAREGVKVYFLFDEIGSIGLDSDYLRELEAAGVHVAPFSTNQRDGRKYQLNFRNHRKILVVDGKVAFTGGLNVGDEYLGKDEKLTPWRDTHLRVAGPSASLLQVPFGEDWYWATGTVLDELDWEAQACADGGDVEVLCLPTGPADPLESCGLFFLTMINNAERRLWIATPYFVPDMQIISALQLAALRGVDVRILIPDLTDNRLVHFSSYSYLEEVELAGIKTYRYENGFLHQKVLLMDDETACVGSANFDNRSFRLNFEITLAVKDAAFAEEVAAMLEEDFANSRLTSAEDFQDKPFHFRLAARIARLLSPIQ